MSACLSPVFTPSVFVYSEHFVGIMHETAASPCEAVRVPTTLEPDPRHPSSAVPTTLATGRATTELPSRLLGERRPTRPAMLSNDDFRALVAARPAAAAAAAATATTAAAAAAAAAPPPSVPVPPPRVPPPPTAAASHHRSGRAHPYAPPVRRYPADFEVQESAARVLRAALEEQPPSLRESRCFRSVAAARRSAGPHLTSPSLVMAPQLTPTSTRLTSPPHHTSPPHLTSP